MHFDYQILSYHSMIRLQIYINTTHFVIIFILNISYIYIYIYILRVDLLGFSIHRPAIARVSSSIKPDNLARNAISLTVFAPQTQTRY